MYRLRYPVLSGGESRFVGASGVTTGIPFILRDSLTRRQGGVGAYILMRHGEGRINSSQRERKSWEEKLNAAKDLLEVVQLKGKAKRHWNRGDLGDRFAAGDFFLYSDTFRRPSGHDHGSSGGGGEETCC